MFASIFSALDSSNSESLFDSIWEEFISENEDLIGGLISHLISSGVKPEQALRSFGVLAFQVKNLVAVPNTAGTKIYTGVNGGGLLIPKGNTCSIKTDGTKALYFLDPNPKTGKVGYTHTDFTYEDIMGEKYARVITLGVPELRKGDLTALKGETITILALIQIKAESVGTICTDPKKPEFKKVWYNCTVLKSGSFEGPVFLPGLKEEIVIYDDAPISDTQPVITTTSKLKGNKLKTVVQKKWSSIELPNDWETLTLCEKESFVDEFIDSLDEALKPISDNLRDKFIRWERVKVKLPTTPPATPVPCLTPDESEDESGQSKSSGLETLAQPTDQDFNIDDLF